MAASGSDEEVLVGCECEQDDDNVGPVANTLRLVRRLRSIAKRSYLSSRK